MQTNRLFHCIPVVALSNPKRARLWSVHTLIYRLVLGFKRKKERKNVNTWLEMELSRTPLVPTTLQECFDQVVEHYCLRLRVLPCLTKWFNLSEDNRCCKESINRRNVLTKAALLNRPTKTCQPVCTRQRIIWLERRIGCWDTVCFLYKGCVH